MHTRLEFLQRLRSSEKYALALKSARTDAERAAIAATVEEFVGSFAEVLGPLIARSQSDPEFARQLNEVLNERQHVVTGGPTTSGSMNNHG
jgi:hypothetical protein